jgi:hypothetical protein
MILDLDAVTRNEIASMVYARWSIALESLKKVKGLTWMTCGKFCPQNEWPQYHANMIHSAETELETAVKLKNDICPFSPLIKGE